MKVSALPVIGAALAGGFYAGRFLLAGIHHALIVSPIDGDIEGAWGEYGKKLDGCRSFVDGRRNTIDLAEAGSELAQKILQLEIAGINDWFLAARDQLELIYRNLKPGTDENGCYYLDGYNASSVPPGAMYEDETPGQTDVTAFQTDGEHALREELYWTSTQYSANGAFSQYFGDGYQGYDAKDGKFRARAVRQIQLVIE